jgi:hypothetical protein
MNLLGDTAFIVALDAGRVMPDCRERNLVAVFLATSQTYQFALLGDIHVLLLCDDGCSKSRSRPMEVNDNQEKY